MKRFGLALALAAVLLSGNVARAGVTFEYVAGTPTVGSSSTSIPIYFQETDTGGSTVFGSSSVTGLLSFGILSYATNSGTSTISSFTAASGFSQYHGTDGTTAQNNTGLTQSYPNSTANQVASSTASLASLGTSNAMDYFNSANSGGVGATLVSGKAGNGVYQIQVGTLTVANGTATNFNLTSMFNSPGDNASAQQTVVTTSNGSNVDLDDNGTFNGASFIGAADPSTVTTFSVGAAVPEPSSMMLCGLVVFGMGYAGLRRRKKAQTDVTEVAA
jgi:hypothetical protein